MEKPNTKTLSTSKPICSDSKSKQDGSQNKRLPRVKEGASPRPENRRKSNPQRTRELFDKRPRNRNGAVCERYRSEISDGAVTESSGKHGCKKMNLNHLLNFTLAPLDNWEGGGGRRGVGVGRHRPPKYNKELFLQANCQFVARDGGMCAVPQKNPDVLVEWWLIEEIRLPCYDVSLCPICLHVPVAAKITRCGHVYCWPCLLHYLSLTDKTWQKCPICFEAVHKTDLKSVSLRKQKCFSVGDSITMCLMRREKTSLLSTPVAHQVPTASVCSVSDDDVVTRYQKLLFATQKEIKLILDRERCELEKAYLAEKDTPEVCFIESALLLLVAREKDLHQAVDNEENVLTEATQNNAGGQIRNHLTSISSTDSTDESYIADINENSTKLNLDNAAKTTPCDLEKGVSYFYQAEDGQHIYLHSINVRMLLKEFRSLESAPHSITAKIVEVERATVTEVLRKKLRYLQHLPLTCEFQFVELDFASTVSEQSLQQFEDEIKKRRFARNRKARDERRREKMIELEENKKLGKYPKATYNLNSVDQFPAYNPEDFVSLSPPKHEILHESHLDSDCVNENGNSYAEDFPQKNLVEPAMFPSNCAPITSFAQMLRDGQKLSRPPQDIKPLAPPTSLNPDSEDEGTAAPDYRNSFSDAFQVALDRISIQETKGGLKQSSKKKKKGKKQLLFTTAMCCNNN